MSVFEGLAGERAQQQRETRVDQLAPMLHRDAEHLVLLGAVAETEAGRDPPRAEGVEDRHLFGEADGLVEGQECGRGHMSSAVP
jgi:hypothetical protein